MELNYTELLPEEILFKIFDYLSPNMIKIVAFVCKRWNQIIIDSTLISNKFILKLKGYEVNHKVERNYKSASINAQKMEKNILNFIDLSAIQSLALNCSSIKSAHLSTILRNLPVLSELCLCLIIEDIPKNLEKVELNIKKLSISNHFNDFLVHISTNKLIALRLDLDGSNFEGYVNVINFIGHQKNLEVLSLKQFAATVFLKFLKVYEFDFRLKTFIIDGKYIPRELEEHLSRFLMIHKDSLETVRLCQLNYFWRFNIYELIWNNMPNIKHIDINIWELKTAMEERNDDRWNNHISVESITFCGNSNEQDIQCLRTILKKFPKTKILKLYQYRLFYNWNKVIRRICSDMKNLTVLQMPYIFDQKLLKIQSIYFPNLKEFYMGEVKDKRISHFFRRHSNTLKKIGIVWTNDDLVSPILKELMMYDNNPRLIIRMNVKDLMIIYDNRIINLNNTWTLELITETWKFIYEFPDDSAHWNEHKKYCTILVEHLMHLLADFPTHCFHGFTNNCFGQMN